MIIISKFKGAWGPSTRSTFKKTFPKSFLKYQQFRNNIIKIQQKNYKDKEGLCPWFVALLFSTQQYQKRKQKPYELNEHMNKWQNKQGSQDLS